MSVEASEEPMPDVHEAGEENFAAADVGAYDEAGDEEMGEDGEEAAAIGTYTADIVNDQVFDELHLDGAVVADVQASWTAFLASAESRAAAGEAIYAALFDAAPSLQGMFKTPRAVMSMRFMNGLHKLIGCAHDPKELKSNVEVLGFQHLDLEVTAPRVAIFRDAIIDLLLVELGVRVTPRAKSGWATLLNYIGGSYIYVRVKYAERLSCLVASWAQANNRSSAEEGGEDGNDLAGGAWAGAGDDAKQAAAKSKTSRSKRWFQSSKNSQHSRSDTEADGSEPGQKSFQNTSVPKCYSDMFRFNAAVMGFANNMWMQEVLQSFDAIVMNVANSYRLQEECDVLCLRMAKCKGEINLSQYKSVMLASLRSLVKDWGSLHEVSWSWLWQNVERLLQQQLGKPAMMEIKLAGLLSILDETALMYLRREVYSKFFELAPAGQDYFKQSTTRLHFIADKLTAMTLDMYKDPVRMVEDISALGLRHVGYGIPTDLFGPFITGAVQVVRELTDDEAAEEAFRWSLSLISRILVRVITEGSTIVMKAINANSGRQLKKAVSCAPRARRALWMLNVQVGTQSISPLLWAIETGSLDAASAIISDLLTIRADRDRYYYGMDIMFERHPDIVKRLCLDASAFLPVLLDGLIWRSRTTVAGRRRVNYYVKHLIVDSDGGFSRTTEWFTNHEDPKIVCHPVVSLVTDLLWQRVALRTFVLGRLWFISTLVAFVVVQSVLTRIKVEHPGAVGDTNGSTIGVTGENVATEDGAIPTADGSDHSLRVRVAEFVMRLFIYIFVLGSLCVYHTKKACRDLRNRAFVKYGCLKLPEYLGNWQDVARLVLMWLLLLMLCMEPIFHCFGDETVDHLFTDRCPEGVRVSFAYSIFAVAATLVFFLLLSDISVCSTRVSAFVLICTKVISELTLYLFGIAYVVIAFACAVSALEQDDPGFKGIPSAALSSLRLAFGMDNTQELDDLSAQNPVLMFALMLFVVVTLIFLLNLLIAQLCCAYQAAYQDMVGFARLHRGKIVCESMATVSKHRWAKFVDSLRLDERIEFGEGDVGLAGGIQVEELASEHITTVDMIRRFGGSTSPSAEWPEQNDGDLDDADRFERLERLIEKAMKRVTGSGRGHKKGSASSSGQSIGQGSDSSAIGNDESSPSGGVE